MPRHGGAPSLCAISSATAEGEELSTREIKAALRDLIDAEDKRNPLSDDALREALAQKGYPIARRTVAKYREQLGFWLLAS